LTDCRQALGLGLDPVMALQMASLNTARHFGLRQTGALALGYDADFILFDDFQNFTVNQVYKAGRKIAENGQMLADTKSRSNNPGNSMHPASVQLVDFQIRARGREVWTIGLIPNQIITRKIRLVACVTNGLATADPERDILKIAVIERHHGSGNIGLGFVQGMGLRRGAIGSTVAHDSHNIVIVGTNDRYVGGFSEPDEMGGGQIVIADGEVLAALPLPIAGLLSDRR
jgi:adenine deaminase